MDLEESISTQFLLASLIAYQKWVELLSGNSCPSCGEHNITSKPSANLINLLVQFQEEVEFCNDAAQDSTLKEFCKKIKEDEFVYNTYVATKQGWTRLFKWSNIHLRIIKNKTRLNQLLSKERSKLYSPAWIWLMGVLGSAQLTINSFIKMDVFQLHASSILPRFRCG